MFRALQQNMLHGDAQLRILQENTFTYPGWKDDFGDAVDDRATLETMKRRQCVYDGDRSNNVQLRELDSQRYSYPRWKKDFKKAEIGYFSSHKSFMRHVDAMKKRERFYCIESQQSYEKESTQEQQQQHHGGNSGNMCRICLENEKTHAYVPCGHLCVCRGCAKTYAIKKCIICRQKASHVIRIFPS